MKKKSLYKYIYRLFYFTSKVLESFKKFPVINYQKRKKKAFKKGHIQFIGEKKKFTCDFFKVCHLKLNPVIVITNKITN